MRSGEWRGATGKKLKDVVAIGIGGSYLGPAFVHTALSFDHKSQEEAEGRCAKGFRRGVRAGVAVPFFQSLCGL